MSERSVREVVEGAVPEHLVDASSVLPLLEASNDAVLLRVPTVGRFLARRASDTIEVERAPDATDDDVRCFARGPVTAAALLLDGHLPIRGSCVVIDGAAVVLCGIGGSGASTLAASLALRGHTVIADRIVDVDPTSSTVRAHDAAVELWPDGAEVLGVDSAGGRVVRPALAKRAHSLGPTPSALGDQAVPVRAVVALSVATDPSTGSPDSVDGHAKLGTLVRRLWHACLVTPLVLDETCFRWSVSLANAAPLVRLRRTRGRSGFAALPEMTSRVEELVQ